MEKKFENAQNFVGEAIESLKESISIADEAGDEMGAFLDAGHDPMDAADDPRLKVYWKKLELEELATDYLIKFMFDIEAPEYADDDEESFPQHALDCLTRYKESGDVEEIKKAFWYLKEYHDFGTSIEY